MTTKTVNKIPADVKALYKNELQDEVVNLRQALLAAEDVVEEMSCNNQELTQQIVFAGDKVYTAQKDTKAYKKALGDTEVELMQSKEMVELLSKENELMQEDLKNWQERFATLALLATNPN